MMTLKYLCFVLYLDLTVRLSSGDAPPGQNTAMLNKTAFKDMYILKATEYQIGILTNETRGNQSSSGMQTAITFYQNNGSNINPKSIPQALLTNITGQQIVSVAPVAKLNATAAQPWIYLNNILYGRNQSSNLTSNISIRHKRALLASQYNADAPTESTNHTMSELHNNVFIGSWNERSSDNSMSINNDTKDPIIKEVKGTAVIPKNIAIQSIDLPLLSFKSNVSQIPIPIPNVSIVHYAKINTLIRAADNKL